MSFSVEARTRPAAQSARASQTRLSSVAAMSASLWPRLTETMPIPITSTPAPAKTRPNGIITNSQVSFSR